MTNPTKHVALLSQQSLPVFSFYPRLPCALTSTGQCDDMNGKKYTRPCTSEHLEKHVLNAMVTFLYSVKKNKPASPERNETHLSKTKLDGCGHLECHLFLNHISIEIRAGKVCLLLLFIPSPKMSSGCALCMSVISTIGRAQK